MRLQEPAHPYHAHPARGAHGGATARGRGHWLASSSAAHGNATYAYGGRGGRGGGTLASVAAATAASMGPRMREHRSRLESLLHGHPLGDLSLGMDGGEAGGEGEEEEQPWGFPSVAVDSTLEDLIAAVGAQHLHETAAAAAVAAHAAHGSRVVHAGEGGFYVAAPPGSGPGSGWLRAARASRSLGASQAGPGRVEGSSRGAAGAQGAAAGEAAARPRAEDEESWSGSGSEGGPDGGPSRLRRPRSPPHPRRGRSSSSCSSSGSEAGEGEAEEEWARGTQAPFQATSSHAGSAGMAAMSAYLAYLGVPHASQVSDEEAHRAGGSGLRTPKVVRCSFSDNGENYIEQHW